MKDTIQTITDRIVQSAHSWLQDNSSFSSKPVRCRIDGHTFGTYLLNIVRTSKTELLLQELISFPSGGQEVFRSWSISHLGSNKGWHPGEVRKFGRQIHKPAFTRELQDLEQRIQLITAAEEGQGVVYAESLLKAEEALAVDHPPEIKQKRGTPFRLITSFTHNHPLTALLFLFALLGASILGLYFFHVNALERKVALSMAEFSRNMDAKIDSFIKETEDEIHFLVQELQKKRSSFETDKKNAYINIMRLHEELGNHLPARKAAYHLIAENVLSAASYGEIFFELSRLPTEEFQARRLIATDRQTVIPLSEHTLVFSGMVHPVRLENERNDGRGFRITDGYMRERQDPFGAGGVLPHFAVDIINVSNIAYVNYAGQIIRDGNHPGYVVSSYPGVVEDIGFDERYGWYAVVRHELNEEVSASYPQAEGWATFYAHLDDSPIPEAGKLIEADEVIGKIGNTGYSTGPHLHFEVRIIHPRGIFSHNDERFDKINPYPEEG